jgi:hypothetical protein
VSGGVNEGTFFIYFLFLTLLSMRQIDSVWPLHVDYTDTSKITTIRSSNDPRIGMGRIQAAKGHGQECLSGRSRLASVSWLCGGWGCGGHDEIQ